MECGHRPALTLGTQVTGQLNPGTAAEVYTLAGRGQVVDFSTQTTSAAAANANWTLYGPDDAEVGEGPCARSGLHAHAADDRPLHAGARSARRRRLGFLPVHAQAIVSNTVPLVLATGTNGSMRMTYDPVFHQLTSETDALGRETLYDIDPTTGLPLSTTQVATSGNLVTTYTYTANGQIASTTDPTGVTTATRTMPRKK